jgi:hypothetical protein
MQRNHSTLRAWNQCFDRQAPAANLDPAKKPGEPSGAARFGVATKRKPHSHI